MLGEGPALAWRGALERSETAGVASLNHYILRTPPGSESRAKAHPSPLTPHPRGRKDVVESLPHIFLD